MEVIYFDIIKKKEREREKERERIKEGVRESDGKGKMVEKEKK